MESKIPLYKNIKINLKPHYGAGYLNLKPQEGPQQLFVSCHGGFSGEDPRDEDFPLIFYGGAK